MSRGRKRLLPVAGMTILFLLSGCTGAEAARCVSSETAVVSAPVRNREAMEELMEAAREYTGTEPHTEEHLRARDAIEEILVSSEPEDVYELMECLEKAGIPAGEIKRFTGLGE